MFYSKKENGFFDGLSFKPDDSVEITDERYAELIDGIESGKLLSADNNGYPILGDPELTDEQQIDEANIVKNGLLEDAMATISLWQTELQLGIISDEDKASLIAWMQYIKAVQAVDTSKAPDITWPVPPAA
ncbi:TPA: tail fiber assembly protein [Escherichia coli]|nr:tail fiber assembly protein [Escherichia coli]